jgi:hypothetical protein
VLPRAKTTLVCVEQPARGGGSGARPSPMASAPPAGRGSGSGGGSGSLGGGLSDLVDGARVRLVMYRAKAGIHGFHLFDTVHVAYM